MATTLYIIVTMILFSLNLMANLAVLGMNKQDKFPVTSFLASIASVGFVIWAIVLLISA
jgi:hypothetical protein